MPTATQRTARAISWWRAFAVGGVAVATLTTVGLASCANPAAPPGGPPDFDTPRFVRFSPDTNALDVSPRQVVIHFDEVITEVPGGARSLAELILVSPRSGEVSASWKRNRIEIRPKDGFRDSSIYTITIAPGITDLNNNRIDTTTRLVFSTGGPIPTTILTGALFDWPEGKGAPRAIIEAIAERDSTTYITVADSVGRYRMPHVPPGEYLVRGYVDRNSNRELDRTELWDSQRVTLLDSAAAELYAFVHDTMPIRLAAIAVEDTARRLKVTLDKPLAISDSVTTQQIRLRTLPDSVPYLQRTPIVRTPDQQRTIDSLEREQRRDSLEALRAARDTTLTPEARARRDSLAKVQADSAAAKARRDSIALREREEREERRLLALRGGRPLPVRDTTPPPKPSRPIPIKELIIVFDEPLPPDARFELIIDSITSLSGIKGSARRPFRVPERDTTPPDTTAADSLAADSLAADSLTADSVRADSIGRDTTRPPIPPDSVPPDSVPQNALVPRAFAAPARRAPAGR